MLSSRFRVENELGPRTKLSICDTLVRPSEYGLDVFGWRAIVEIIYNHKVPRAEYVPSGNFAPGK